MAETRPMRVPADLGVLVWFETVQMEWLRASTQRPC
jgi:hypothetical protein